MVKYLPMGNSERAVYGEQVPEVVHAENSAFALAYAKAKQNEGTVRKERVKKKEKTLDSQQGVEVNRAIKEYQRKAANIEALRVGATNIGAQWSEFIESPIVNPRAKRATIQAWRPLFIQLTSGNLSDEERASIIFELTLSMGVSDTTVSNGQMRYLKGVSQKGFFQEIRRVPNLATPGVMYFVSAFSDLSELTTKQRNDYLNFLRRESSTTARPINLRLDRVTSRWLGTVSHLRK